MNKTEISAPLSAETNKNTLQYCRRIIQDKKSNVLGNDGNKT